MIDFDEIADRVWAARSEWFEVNVGLVAGSAGLLVIDTNTSSDLAEQTLAAVRRVSAAPIIAALNTHVHADHTLGNATFAEAGAELIAHELAAAALVDHVAAFRADEARVHAGHPGWPDLLTTPVAVPARTFSSALAIDLGDRVVEAVHPGRGHTDGDVIVLVADADVAFLGDLVEESGPPAFGNDCFPMDWPASLDLALTLIGPGTTVVPGHGRPVDREFVDDQRSAIGVVAETIRDLAARGIAVTDALAAAQWPYPQADLLAAVTRGYEQLPRFQRRLPLV